MQTPFRTLRGNTLYLDILPDETVGDVKLRLHEAYPDKISLNSRLIMGDVEWKNEVLFPIDIARKNYRTTYIIDSIPPSYVRGSSPYSYRSRSPYSY